MSKKNLILWTIMAISITWGLSVIIDEKAIVIRWQKEAIATYNEQLQAFNEWKIDIKPKPQEWYYDRPWVRATIIWVQLSDSIFSILGTIIPVGILLYSRRKQKQLKA